MTFEELKPYIDELSEIERKRVHAYVLMLMTKASSLTDVEDILDAAEEIRSSMSEKDLDEMINAMNGKVIADKDSNS